MGLYLLKPILASLTRETGHPFLFLAIPMLGFLLVMPDGTVLCLYEADTSIDCARFNLEWVTSKWP